MSKRLVKKLRSLRSQAQELNRTTVPDLKPFLHQLDGITFRLLPDRESKVGHVTVGTTCTALMALATSGQIGDFYGENSGAANSFKLAVDSPWDSSGLDRDNAFTTTLILRAAGLLVSHSILAREDAHKLVHTMAPENGTEDRLSLVDLATSIANDIEKKLRVQGYPATTTLGYWFIDAADRLGLDFSKESWSGVVEWTAKRFKEELGLVAAGQDAMMDPVSMAMGGCLSVRLGEILRKKPEPEYREMLKILPSDDALEHGLTLLFKYQSESGIWPKYFPLFYYPNAGVNYCFSVELLEAVLHEFENWPIFEKDTIVEGLDKALRWCTANRFRYTHEQVTYYGWNSGSEIESLRGRVPEGWATAVVHMFLHTLGTSLSTIIDKHLSARRATLRPTGRSSRRWDNLVDASVKIGGDDTTVLSVLNEHLVEPSIQSASTGRLDKKRARSVLLFGPPGNSKTSIVRAMTEKLGWPLVELSPSDFLRKGMDKLFTQANQVFEDISDLARAVVFFDEMDAVAQNRVADLDITRQLLTTSMLPKIAELHDDARVLFFMATNHISSLDAAITRPGRFDLLLFVGPPSWKDKLAQIDKILQEIDISESASVEQIKTLLDRNVDQAEIAKFLGLFTYGEFVSFLRKVQGKKGLLEVLNNMDKSDFHREVRDWATNLITLKENDFSVSGSERNTPRDEYEKDKDKSKVQY